MYYVEKQGVYFISDDLDVAKAFADTCAEADSDNYHSWDVMEYHEGIICPDQLDTSFKFGYMDQNKAVYWARKQKPLKEGVCI